MTTINVEVDLNDYYDECNEVVNGNIREQLKEYVEELEKELYIYVVKSNITVEDIYRKLKEMI